MTKTLLKKHLDKYVVAFIAIVIILLDIIDITSQSIIFETTVAVLAILIFYLIKLENKIDKLTQIDNIEGLISFRLNRDNLPTLEETFSQASEEIIFWGSALYAVHDRSDLIQRKLGQGCKVKILMMDLYNEHEILNPNIDNYQKITRHVGFKDRVSVAKMEFEEIYNSLDNYRKELFEIRYYDLFPTANYVIIDRDSTNGFIRIEPCIYGCYSHESPSFDIGVRSASALFKVTCRSFEEVWSKSKLYSSDSQIREKG
jgi:hypothetical protein